MTRRTASPHTVPATSMISISQCRTKVDTGIPRKACAKARASTHLGRLSTGGDYLPSPSQNRDAYGAGGSQSTGDTA